ncbi:MAG: BrnT family toxin [Desulfobacteraceae bacterium]|nr:BrnT family toxin [Desulfobacteraceae bacterium]MBC2719895.1 BrnT family toxin [Desulfobacteraceae bacterium]
MKFEWDQRKAKSNLKKHGISFQEATTVFGDALSITFDDPDHSIDYHRLLTFRLSRTGKLLIVSHAERSKTMRIIGARPVTKQERQIYEEG